MRRFPVLAAGMFPIAATVAVLGGGVLPAAASSSWSTYHGDAARTGVAAGEPAMLPAAKAWTANLDGAVYGQPLVFDGRVLVATENNSLYGLDAHDGTVLWRFNAGPPVPLSVIRAGTGGCGNIDPLGMTGTPVVDPASARVFAVATVHEGGTNVHHQLVGVNAYTGALETSTRVDPPNQRTLNIQQRAGLNLGNGRVYFGYGGLAGDCEPYHGYAVSVKEDGTDVRFFNVTPTTSEGAVWATGGPVIDGNGFVYVSTGNGNPNKLEHQESVVKLDPLLNFVDQFTPAEWSHLDATDADLSSMSPALLPGGKVFQIGKQHDAFIAETAHLSAGATRITNVCSLKASSAAAVANGKVYVPCDDGIREVDIATATKGWQTASGADSSPVLAAGKLWSLDWTGSTGKLFALDPADGTVDGGPIDIGPVPHFAAPAVALGLVLTGTMSGVVAVAGPSGVPPHAGPVPLPPTCVAQPDHAGVWLAAADGGVFGLGGAPFCGSLGGRQLNAPVVALAGTSGPGYWLVASDGGVFSFNVGFFGSTGGIRLNRPVVGMAGTPSGKGYWLVASDGGVFSFGDAKFFGSTGAVRLNQPIVGMAATPSGKGYWLVARDGGVFSFGDAVFHGSGGAAPQPAPAVGIAVSESGNGYSIARADGGVLGFGDAVSRLGLVGVKLAAPVLGIAGD